MIIPSTPNLLVEKAWLDIISESYDILKHMSKYNKNGIGITLVSFLWKIESEILEAISYTVDNRLKILNKIDKESNLTYRLFYVMLLNEIISPGRYTVITEKFKEFGNLLGGLIKNSKK
mgnify:CR=1 FL=1